MSEWNQRDLAGALLFASLGAFVLVGAADLRFGSAQNMGPGYFPTMLGTILIALSVLVAAQGLKHPVGTTNWATGRQSVVSG